MKRIVFNLTVLLTVAFAPPLLAQGPQPGTSPDKEPRDFAPRGPLANFTPEERQKLKQAREKAMEDPKVQDAVENRKDANEKFESVMRPALLAVDPTLEPILDEMKKARQSQPGGAPPPRNASGEMARRPFAMLKPEERERLKAAHEKVKDNPEVKAAQQERVEAEKAFATAMHDAMVAADPSVEPLLKKIEEFRREHPGMPGGPGRPNGKSSQEPQKQPAPNAL